MCLQADLSYSLSEFVCNTQKHMHLLTNVNLWNYFKEDKLSVTKETRRQIFTRYTASGP